MEVKSAIFKTSASNVNQCPADKRAEFAFIGRSNVGKSSLINMLCVRKELARTSSTPGKTITLNYFLINDSWYIVDLPGYGYAKLSRDLREQWEKHLKGYLLNRQNLACLFVLIDSRIDPQKVDLEFLEFLGEKGVPFAIVFTKTDDDKAPNIKERTDKFLQIVGERWEELPPVFYTSSIKKLGRDELLDFIEKLV